MTKKDIVNKLDKNLKKICPNVQTTRSKYRGCDSDWSRQIIPVGAGACSTIKDIFSIDVADWEKKFASATSGMGNEDEKILTLHSSSLLALLCFSYVSKDNPLWINGSEYVQCWFEVENEVFERPSSIDVVLKSTDGTLLFLESKFTEYLNGYSPNISDNYFNFYKEILPKLHNCPLQMVFPKTWKENEKTKVGLGLVSTSKNKKYADLYLGGIKQCFSHLIGLAKGPKNKHEECWLDVADNKIIFGTIVYKLRDFHFSIYREFYSSTIGTITASMLEESVNGCGSHVGQIEVLPNILTYQDVFGKGNFKLSDKVRKYYEL